MHKFEKTFANCGCLLRCIAVPIPGSGFQAQVEIIRYEDQALLQAKTLTPDEPFRSSAEAIDSARAWSVSWVRQNG
jgi:hypothetical protein